MTLLYEGKAKQILTSEKENEIIIHYKDDATALNGKKKEAIKDKGYLNNNISSMIYEYLESHGIHTHYIKKINDLEQLCELVEIVPLEVIVRNYAAGSFSKRYGIEEGIKLDSTVYEICLKDDNLNDPFINDSIALSLKLVKDKDLKKIYEMTKKINNLLKELFSQIEVELIDFKLEFGLSKDGEVILADEVTPDTCRLWDKNTLRKLDKDLFRKDLGGLIDAYQVINSRLKEQLIND